MADDARPLTPTATAATDPASQAPTRMRLSVDRFQAMVEAGVFAGEDRPFELVRGEIIVMPMDGGPHMNVGARLMMLWAPILAANTALRACLKLFMPGAIRLSAETARAPDAMLALPETVGRGRWPEAKECLLAVEFSDTTLRYDESEKRPDYAAAGLRELWIVRVAHLDVRVCREPATDGGWGFETLLKGEQLLSALAAPELTIPVRALFAPDEDATLSGS